MACYGISMDDTRTARFAGVLREVARGGLAGLLAGMLVGGIGGRVVMMVVALLNRDSFGRFTENGEAIGEFTIGGTLALLLFGGLGAGMAAGVLWVIISPWVPWSGGRRWLVAMPIAIALGAFTLVESTNRDFLIVGPTWFVLVLLFGLVGLAGAATALFDEWLERRLPRVGPSAKPALVRYGVIAVLGIPGLLLTVGAFFDEEFATGPTPMGVGPVLLVIGLATVVLWTRRVVLGRAVPPRPLVLGARIGVFAAVVLGALHLAAEIGRLYARV